MKKFEISKLILFIDISVAVILMAIVVAGTFCRFDVSNIVVISGFWDAQLSVAVGFYFWKAKNENRSKGTQNLIKTLAAQHGIDAATRVAEIIYKD